MNPQNHPFQIKRNKLKVFVLTCGSLIFVCIGLWLVISPPNVELTYLGIPINLFFLGAVIISFFGICAYFLVEKLVDKKPGLIIDEQGLIDNSSAVSSERIFWTDITRISVIEIHRQKMLILMVKNPQEYINQRNSAFKRKIMQMNLNTYGTPICISSSGLKISFDELLNIVESRLEHIKNT